MANGCLTIRLTPDEIRKMTLDQKVECLIEVALLNQKEIAALKRWWNLKTLGMFLSAAGGGAIMILVLTFFHVPVLP